MLGNAGDSDSDGEYLLHQVPASGTSQPYNVTLTVSGQELCMEIDTGASLSLVSEVTYKKLWPGKHLLPTPVKLTTYSGEKLPVVSQMQAQVHHDNQSAQLSLVVVKGDGPSLLGRDWLSSLNLNWHQVYYHSEVLDQNSEVFDNTLGTLKGCKAKIYVDSSIVGHVQSLVEQQLDKLEKDGVIEPVQHSEWAAPSSKVTNWFESAVTLNKQSTKHLV